MFPCLCIWNQWLANCNHQTNKFLSTGLDYFCLFLFSFPTQHHQQAPAPQVLRLPLSGELIEGSPERTTDIIQVEQPGPHLILLLTYLLTTCHDLMVELLCSILFVLCLCIRLLFITFFSIFTWLKNFFSLLLSSALFFSLLFSFPSPILHYWHQILLGLFFICYTIKLLGQNASFLLIIKFFILMLQFHCILNVLLTSVSVAVFSIVIEVL